MHCSLFSQHGVQVYFRILLPTQAVHLHMRLNDNDKFVWRIHVLVRPKHYPDGGWCCFCLGYASKSQS